MKLTDVWRCYIRPASTADREIAVQAERLNDELRQQLEAARKQMLQETLERARDA